MNEFVLAVYLMCVGLCVAGAATHLYQALAQQPAMLRYDGRTVWGMFGNLAMSFVCGPYILLQVGWRQDQNGTAAMTSVVLSSLLAFGWSLITGILFVGLFLGIIG